jgi:ABC-2 type transport system ATP-binding protein
MNVIEASGLGKRYGSTWALRECSLAVPAGHVAAAVGPNGAGKTTLLNLVVGLATPTAGIVTVLGGEPAGSPAALEDIAYVAQDAPLYKNLPVADMVRLTSYLNRRFDHGYARERLSELGIPLKRKAGKLSGGQQAQLALTLALARRPRLLVLDEPLANLDPLARHDFMATVLAAAAEHGMSVVLSSHVLAELERVGLPHPDLRRPGAGGRRRRRPARPPPRADRTGGRGRPDCPAAVCRARPPRASSGAPAGQDQRTGRSGAAWLGGAPDQPGRTRPGLPARARRRGAARPGAHPEGRAYGGNPMTTLNTPAPAPARRNTTPQPVPWRRLAWVSWRHYRAAAVGAAAFLGVLALYLLIMGLRIRGAYAAAAACSLSVPGQHCTGVFILLDNDYFVIAETSAAVLLAIPVLMGVFAGAPILARELDTGTFRFAWTQGAGRTRWTLARLALPALTLTALAAAFSQLFGWFFYPWFAAREFAQASSFAPVYFTLTGIAFAAWTLAAFAIGALASVLIRRVVPAMAVAMAAWAGLLLAHHAGPAPALRGPADHQHRQDGRLELGDQRLVDRAERPACHQRAPDHRAPQRWPPPRLHRMDDLPARRAVLALPAHRGRLAARPFPAPDRRHHLAGPPPRGLNPRRNVHVAFTRSWRGGRAQWPLWSSSGWHDAGRLERVDECHSNGRLVRF